MITILNQQWLRTKFRPLESSHTQITWTIKNARIFLQESQQLPLRLSQEPRKPRRTARKCRLVAEARGEHRDHEERRDPISNRPADSRYPLMDIVRPLGVSVCVRKPR